MKFEYMGSPMTDDQFMTHVLNNLTRDYELQTVFLEEKNWKQSQSARGQWTTWRAESTIWETKNPFWA